MLGDFWSLAHFIICLLHMYKSLLMYMNLVCSCTDRNKHSERVAVIFTLQTKVIAEKPKGSLVGKLSSAAYSKYSVVLCISQTCI